MDCKDCKNYEPNEKMITTRIEDAISFWKSWNFKEPSCILVSSDIMSLLRIANKKYHLDLPFSNGYITKFNGIFIYEITKDYGMTDFIKIY